MRAPLALLAAVLLAPLVALPAAQAAAPSMQPGQAQPRAGSITISSATELFALQDDSTHWQGSIITLANNIVMPDDSVITRPIGTAATPFTSTFDGDLKSISNLRGATP